MTVSKTTAALIEMLQQRDAHGLAKYGTTLDRTDLTLRDWLQHQAEELLDGAGYALAAIRAINAGMRVEIIGWIHEDELPKNYPYDAMFPHSRVDGVRLFPVFAPAAAVPASDPAPAAVDAEGAAKRTGLRIEPVLLTGSLAIMLDDFEFVRVNYDYRYTDNRHRRWLAERIEQLIRCGDGEQAGSAQPDVVEAGGCAPPVVAPPPSCPRCHAHTTLACGSAQCPNRNGNASA